MSHAPLIVATSGGIYLCERNGDGVEAQGRGLEERYVTSVITREGVILAGTTDGVFRSNDAGTIWTESNDGMTIRHVRWLALHPDISDREFAGTEPAGIFVSHDGGDCWTPRPEVAVLRDRFRWWLPYSPEAGCVRGFAFFGSRVYAAVEVGGVLRSDDAGETWRLASGSTGEPVFEGPQPPLVHADVHDVVGHPSSPDLVFAATAEGFYRSEDGGDTWTVTHAGSYCRDAWVDPADALHIVLGPADDVSKNGRIEETRDGGKTWQPVVERLDLPWPNAMVERFSQIGDELYAIINDGRLYVSPKERLSWRRALPDVPGITAVAQ